MLRGKCSVTLGESIFYKWKLRLVIYISRLSSPSVCVLYTKHVHFTVYANLL